MESAVLKGSSLDLLNTLCETAESSLKSFRELIPASNEVQEHSKLINQLTKTFEKIVNGLEKSVVFAPGQKIDRFDELEDDIQREKLAHTLKIQEKMIIVGEIMKDCAETVNKQGEVLDRIDLEIDRANKYTAKGEIELEKTNVKQRRKKCLCWSLMVVAFGFLVAIIITAVLLSRKR